MQTQMHWCIYLGLIYSRQFIEKTASPRATLLTRWSGLGFLKVCEKTKIDCKDDLLEPQTLSQHD